MKHKKTKARSKTKRTEKTIPVVPSTHKNRIKKNKPLLQGSWKIHAVIFLLLAGATIILYAGTLHIGFFDTDDSGYVIDNPYIRNMSAENLNFIFTHPYFANYSPLHLFSYMIDYAIGGADPYIFHLSSNIWAGIVTGLVFLVALSMTGNRMIAIVSAVLFAVHPVHVESIAWISSRKDLVAAAFILPSFLMYLKYRHAISNKIMWYGLSLFLFVLALAGKLSVATFPAIFLAYDFFIEKRPLMRSLIDKIPYLVAAGIFAMMVSSAQPETGHQIKPFVLTTVMVENFWLLTGFDNYVIYRVPPATGSTILQALGAIVLIAVFLLPLLLRRKYPLIVFLFYWILFAFIPSQVLSFIHPVSDRYLFIPSVASVILIVALIFNMTKKLGQHAKKIALLVCVVIAFFWTRSTLAYIDEWKDPRSVWFAATKKSSDQRVFAGLGIRYQNLADRIGSKPRGEPLPENEAIALANVVWKSDPQLPELLNEWNEGKQDGALEVAFKKHLHQLAWDSFEKALKDKTITMTNIFFRRGLILFDGGRFEEAKKEFYTAINEAAKDTYEEGREEFIVRSYNALGVVAWHESNFREAFQLMKTAQERQIRFGRNWVPELDGNLKRLEGIIASQNN